MRPADERNALLKGLTDSVGSGAYKFAVTSTIVQQNDAATGTRGIHSATGAYWNDEKDGMWHFKHEVSTKGIDVIISVLWMSLA